MRPRPDQDSAVEHGFDAAIVPPCWVPLARRELHAQREGEIDPRGELHAGEIHDAAGDVLQLDELEVIGVCEPGGEFVRRGVGGVV